MKGYGMVFGVIMGTGCGGGICINSVFENMERGYIHATDSRC